jgi:hypothetical protein
MAIKWTSPYTVTQIIDRARALRGKPVIDPRLLPGAYSCMPFLLEVFGWDGAPLEEDWCARGSITQIEASTGAPFIESGESTLADTLVFYVRGKDHVALKVSETTMVHAGYRTIIEIPFVRFMKFYKGVIRTCQLCSR